MGKRAHADGPKPTAAKAKAAKGKAKAKSLASPRSPPADPTVYADAAASGSGDGKWKLERNWRPTNQAELNAFFLRQRPEPARPASSGPGPSDAAASTHGRAGDGREDLEMQILDDKPDATAARTGEAPMSLVDADIDGGSAEPAAGSAAPDGHQSHHGNGDTGGQPGVAVEVEDASRSVHREDGDTGGQPTVAMEVEDVAHSGHREDGDASGQPRVAMEEPAHSGHLEHGDAGGQPRVAMHSGHREDGDTGGQPRVAMEEPAHSGRGWRRRQPAKSGHGSGRCCPQWSS